MNQEIIPFEFKGTPVRVIKDDNGNPWWIGKDVCEACGDKNNYSRLLSRLDPDEKGTSKLHTLGGYQTLITVNEAGLYRLLLRMQPRKNNFDGRMELINAFQREVSHVMLPTLNRTGSYSIKPLPEVTERRYTSDQIDHMNNHVGIMLASLAELTPIDIENKRQLNDSIVELKEITQAFRVAHTRITAVYDVTDTALPRVADVSVRMDAFEERQDAFTAALTHDISKPIREIIGENARKYAIDHKYNPHTVIESLFWNFKNETVSI